MRSFNIDLKKDDLNVMRTSFYEYHCKVTQNPKDSKEIRITLFKKNENDSYDSQIPPLEFNSASFENLNEPRRYAINNEKAWIALQLFFFFNFMYQYHTTHQDFLNYKFSWEPENFIEHSLFSTKSESLTFTQCNYDQLKSVVFSQKIPTLMFSSCEKNTDYRLAQSYMLENIKKIPSNLASLIDEHIPHLWWEATTKHAFVISGSASLTLFMLALFGIGGGLALSNPVILASLILVGGAVVLYTTSKYQEKKVDTIEKKRDTFFSINHKTEINNNTQTTPNLSG